MNINNITIGEDKSKMDEQLIAEVQMHGVIYNRQKYYLNSIGCNTTGKFESKDEAWQIIAMKLGTDIDNCKKRWKYLRERYVSQRKQSDPPIYEHLSRPYLEKMKFLDQHIQPRKSYRNVPNFLTSPNANSSYGEYNMDSSRSNGSTKNHQYLNYHDNLSSVKTEPDQALREFAAAVASQQLQQLGHPGTSHHQNSNDHQQSPNNVQSNNTKNDTFINNSNNYYEQFRENESGSGCIPSSSSSLKSPLSSPPTTGDHNEILNNDNIKKPRVQVNNSTLVEDSSDDHDDSINEDRMLNNSNRTMLNNRQNSSSGLNQMFPNNDFLLALYQQQQPLANRQNIRSSEHLLGELVTSELLKMNKERRKLAQKRILEILFFDD